MLGVSELLGSIGRLIHPCLFIQIEGQMMVVKMKPRQISVAFQLMSFRQKMAAYFPPQLYTQAAMSTANKLWRH